MRTTRRAWAAALAAVIAVATIGGCAPAAPAAPERAAAKGAQATFPLTVTDDAGRPVTIPRAAERVVSLAPANTEIVHSLGALDRVVGVTTWDDYPVEVKGIAKMGDFTTPNLEAIAAARPDLILVTGGVQADVLAKLEGLGATVLVIDPTDLDGVLVSIETVAAAIGEQDQGRAVTGAMRARTAEIEAAVAGQPRVRCFVEIGWNPLFTAGTGTLLDDLVRRAGGTNVVLEPGYVGYSVEQLLKDQPTVYLGTASSLGEAAGIAARPGYARLEAVGEGRVVALSDNLVSRPGPRLVEGLAEVARALHPARF